MALGPRMVERQAQDALELMRVRTGELQSEASNPAGSAWVSANAGTGKTHVLTMRVLRLLLAGTAPERILALTYTKAAAAEMSKRVFDRLAHWVTADDAKLSQELADLTGHQPSADEIRFGRRLFAVAIETPGGLKVQTIHAFCERLLQRFSLEAGVPPGFVILDDQEKSRLLSEAVDKVLSAATAPDNKASPLAAALQCVVRFATEQSFEDLINEALNHRDWLDRSGSNGDIDADLADAESAYRTALGLSRHDRAEDIEAQIPRVISREDLQRAKNILEGGKKTDLDRAEAIGRALRATTSWGMREALCDLFLTKDMEPRASLMTKALADANGALSERLLAAQANFARLMQRLASAHVFDASVSLLRIAGCVMAHYRHAKEQRAALDFDDLVQKASHLLQRSNAVEWVLYKLDGGLDHILVDEAQDTAPLQWQVVRALAHEFFAGEGAGDGKVRTLFAVGDEKQSIYGFQGAAPHMFRQTGDQFGFRAEASGMRWGAIKLSLSFRTVAPLLQAVDGVFGDPERTAGLGDTSVEHIAHRDGQAGLVEVWPLEVPDTAKDESLPWEPLASSNGGNPAARLAGRIADTIRGWLDNGEMLESQGRPVRAGDIIILVRKRAPFAPVMVSALKARGIPVAGSDRLLITDQIAVMDLSALCQVMVLPDDDLSLAALLKSPLFDFDDDDLLVFAPRREGSLWQALQQAAGSVPKFAEAVQRLTRWRVLSRQLAPYEFLAALLDGEGQRARMLARLGPDAADAIDELLNLALAYGEHSPPTLQGFLISLGEGHHEIKRDMEQGRDEVRVMTVHGAKGLEAPIVFLPDTCHASGGRASGTLLKMAGPHADGEVVPFLWPVKGSSKVAAIESARRELEVREREERNRLLYVALTRPRDRLYIAGFQQSRKPASDCWYNLVRAGLEGVASEEATADGRSLLVMRSPQVKPVVEREKKAAAAFEAGPLPEWAKRPAPVEPVLTMPLSPSRLAPLEMEAGEATRRPRGDERTGRKPKEPAILPPSILADEARFLRGTLTHALLEHLPTLPAGRQKAAADAFLLGQAPKLSKAARDGIVTETLAILRDPAFAALFGPESRAEVALSAEIQRPGGGKGPALRLAGKIDRLVRQGDSVLIVDFKTNRPPPRDAEDVAEAYLLQLAAYRLAVQSIFPRCSIRCAILWTDGPRIMEIASATLDAQQARLWELDPGVLDA